jgi:hypothetical protein
MDANIELMFFRANESGQIGISEDVVIDVLLFAFFYL